MIQRTTPKPRPGYVLIVVLLVVVILSLSAYRFTESMQGDFTVAVRATESGQVRVYARSGVAYAMGVLADPATRSSILGSDPSDVPALGGMAVGADERNGGGRFSIYTIADSGSGAGEGRYIPRPGVTDESGKLNLNSMFALDDTGQALYDALLTLPNMTPEVADSIVDWIDPDSEPRDAGAESDSYAGLGYQCKNGPLQSLEELLLVRGVTPQLLYGTDRNNNGRMDPSEVGDFSRGWADWLTVYGRELDIQANGSPRIDLNSDDLQTLYDDLSATVGGEIAAYIVLYRIVGSSTTPTAGSAATADSAALLAAAEQQLANGATARKKINSLSDLLNKRITLPKAADAPANQAALTADFPLNAIATRNAQLGLFLDAVTTDAASYERVPRVNVNTAPPEVLAGLPGLIGKDISSLIQARAGLAADDPATRTAAWLLTSDTMTLTDFVTLQPYVTGVSSVWRVQSVGYYGRGAMTARVEAVIEAATPTPRVLYYRELSDLGRGFDLVR
jgi:type II secretory pathway component PulK